MTEQVSTRKNYVDALITDFSDPWFQAAFRQYFEELGLKVKDWDGLFREMDQGNSGEKNTAYVRTGPEGVIGFIMFIPICFTSWFFEETCGFVREFWVAAEHRGRGLGSGLLALAERYFLEHGIYTSILTTDTAGRFYERRGYRKAAGCSAKNKDEVFVKRLKQGGQPARRVWDEAEF